MGWNPQADSSTPDCGVRTYMLSTAADSCTVKGAHLSAQLVLLLPWQLVTSVARKTVHSAYPTPAARDRLTCRRSGDRGRSPGELWVLSFAGKYLAGGEISCPAPGRRAFATFCVEKVGRSPYSAASSSFLVQAMFNSSSCFCIPTGQAPWGPRMGLTCSGQVNCPCAEVLLRKTLVRA